MSLPSPIIQYSFYIVIPLLYFHFLSGFGNIIISVDIRYLTDNEAGYIKIGFRKSNNPTPATTSPPSTRPATPSPPGMSDDPTRLRVPRPLRRRSVPILDDTLSFGLPVERTPPERNYPGLAEESQEEPASAEYRRPTEGFFDARETTSPIPEITAGSSTNQCHQSPPIIIDRVRSPVDIQ
jgi:hypothetical protein